MPKGLMSFVRTGSCHVTMQNRKVSRVLLKKGRSRVYSHSERYQVCFVCRNVSSAICMENSFLHLLLHSLIIWNVSSALLTRILYVKSTVNAES